MHLPSLSLRRDAHGYWSVAGSRRWRHRAGHACRDYKTATLDRPGPCNRPRVHEDPAVTLTSYPGTVRQLIITGLGRDAPTVIITNGTGITTRALISQYAAA